MEEIRVMEKPEWVSWDDIHELLIAAHKRNVKKGLVMKLAQMSGGELEKRITPNGKCFVALDGDKLVGTASVTFYEGKSWFDKGHLVAYHQISGILPRYQGIGINDDLRNAKQEYIKEVGASVMRANTAESNNVVRIEARQSGYVEVAYKVYRGTDYYSVLFVKWLGKNPFPKWYCKFRFLLSKLYVKTRFKVGGKKRFGI